jgi:hypothetical protein
VLGYYVAGLYLLSTLVRPATAYFAHLRARITTLTREATHPRADVVELKLKLDATAQAARELRAELRAGQRGAHDDLRRTESALAGDLAHTRQLLTADLARLQDGQAADPAAARSRDDELGRRIDQLVRGMEATLAGVSDHRALVRSAPT